MSSDKPIQFFNGQEYINLLTDGSAKGLSTDFVIDGGEEDPVRLAEYIAELRQKLNRTSMSVVK